MPIKRGTPIRFVFFFFAMRNIENIKSSYD